MAGEGPGGPVDGDSVEAFGRDLRLLRLDAGSLTYGAIARTSSLSKSIVADAFGGARLPTERTVHGIVSVLDGDIEQWLARREALAEARHRPPELTEGQRGDVRSGRRTTVLAVGAGMLVGLIVGAGAALGVVEGDTDVPRTAPSTGADVATSGCLDDAVAVARLERPAASVELMHSARCGGWWAHVARGAADGSLSVRLYPSTAAQQAAIELVGAATAPELTTPLLVRPPGPKVCVEAAVALGTETAPDSLGAPLCG